LFYKLKKSQKKILAFFLHIKIGNIHLNIKGGQTMFIKTMKKKMYAFLLLSYMIFLIAPNNQMLLAQQPLRLTQQDQKEIVDKISILLEENYLFPEIGREIGVYLQKKLNEQKYRKISNPKLFARQITSDLQQINHDKHLSLVHDPQRVKDLKTEESQPSDEELREIRQRRFERRRRNNFGFRKVEILEGNIGYLDLRSFRSTDYAASTALGALSFLSNSDAVIIDLRDNYGGGASMYLLLISYFFDSEMIHLSDLINRRSKSTQQFWTLPYVPGKRLSDVDLYILTSKRTFSAAEEFTYDLQCLERAVIVGETTGGGAHLTTRMVVDDNFYMFIPFAGSRNPITNTNWEGVGVQPDIEVAEVDALKTAYLLALKTLIKKTTDENWKGRLESLITKMETEK